MGNVIIVRWAANFQQHTLRELHYWKSESYMHKRLKIIKVQCGCASQHI